MSNKINKSNYEAFLLDLMEGNLSAGERGELLLFLEKHPEIDFDYDLNINRLNADEEIAFEKKESLKQHSEVLEERVVYYLDNELSKSEKLKFELEVNDNPKLKVLISQYEATNITASVGLVYDDVTSLYKFSAFDHELISYTEGLSTLEEKNNLVERAKLNSELLNEFNTYKSTYSIADETVRFPNKKSLKKSATIIYLKNAAPYLSIAALMILLFLVFYPAENKGVLKGSLALVNRIKQPTLNSTEDSSVINYALQTDKKIKAIVNSFKRDSVNENLFQPVFNNKVEQIKNAPLIVSNENGSEVKNLNRPKTYQPVNINYYEEDDDLELNLPSVIAQTNPKEKFSNNLWDEKGDEPIQSDFSKGKKASLSMNVLAFIGKGLKKLGNKNSGAQKTSNPDEGTTEYNVTIAGISITKKQLN